eukprot:1194507-Prorocentrum_minimum.AAC.1
MLDGAWYVVGGGDNTRALCDMTTLQLPPDLAAPEAILRWRGEDGPGGEEEDGPRGEGLALVAARPVGGEAGCLVTFGGYNGQAGTGTGAVHVMVPGPLMDIAEALRQGAGPRPGQDPADGGGAAERAARPRPPECGNPPGAHRYHGKKKMKTPECSEKV